VHAQIEEAGGLLFRPSVRCRDEQLDEMLDEALREARHDQDRVEARRASRAKTTTVSKSAMTSLQQCVDHHVAEEEREMFPKIEERMPEQERERARPGPGQRASGAQAAPLAGAVSTLVARRKPPRATPRRKNKSVRRATTAAARPPRAARRRPRRSRGRRAKRAAHGRFDGM
jgi:hypothetical protein